MKGDEIQNVGFTELYHKKTLANKRKIDMSIDSSQQ